MRNFDDVLINKVSSIRKCVARAREEYQSGKENFANDFMRQDSSLMNIQRACEQAIDLANHVVKLRKLGVPNEARDSFEFLSRDKIIEPELAEKMAKMIGFRNIVIHEYQKLNIDIVIVVIEKNLDDVLKFAEVILAQQKNFNS